MTFNVGTHNLVYAGNNRSRTKNHASEQTQWDHTPLAKYCLTAGSRNGFKASQLKSKFKKILINQTRQSTIHSCNSLLQQYALHIYEI
jgi:hypothetical protein